MRFQLNFKSGKAVYQQLVDQVKVAAASGALQAGRAAPRHPPAGRGAARQSQHGRQGLHRARKPGRHRDRRRQGVLRPRRRATRPSARTCAASSSPSRSTTWSCTRITCRSAGRNSFNSRRTDSTRSSSSAPAPRRHRTHDRPDSRHRRFAISSAATAAPTPSTASTCACSQAAATASSAATAPARRRRSSAC